MSDSPESGEMTIINMLRKKLDDRLWPSIDVNMRIRTYADLAQLNIIGGDHWFFLQHPFRNAEFWSLVRIIERYCLQSQNSG